MTLEPAQIERPWLCTSHQHFNDVRRQERQSQQFIDNGMVQHLRFRDLGAALVSAAIE